MWHEADLDYRSKLLRALPTGSGLRLLDVGCADGSFTEQQRRRIGIPPDHVAGIEVVDDWRAQAVARGFDVRAGDLEHAWPFDNASFDVVVANQVIEHVKRLDDFVGQIRRVLAPGGHAVVCTENLASWHNVAALALGYMPFSATNISATGAIGNPLALHAGESGHEETSMQHVHILTHVALRDIFARHGFAVRGDFAAGYYPLAGRLASRLAQSCPRHAHFIGVIAERP
jgi:SAM-dependent methyltransferase